MREDVRMVTEEIRTSQQQMLQVFTDSMMMVNMIKQPLSTGLALPSQQSQFTSASPSPSHCPQSLARTSIPHQ
ncbi:hypothetical protein EB796_006185 [Bugula neritina]|uniref:Uncharacterized protein n=1 Tax=Bugula neritina TaxID=10212 RepID=A0A7J7JJ36_BUGNE|nr:hypothetical protein EB796_015347 [Bugula neritina]KAF6035509.1 hypothetical protein EB796_006185 [Bugula neritina]